MKAVAEIRPGEPGPVEAVEFVDAPGRGQRRQRKHRVAVFEGVDDLIFRYGFGRVKRNTKGGVGFYPLQDVHVVGQHRAFLVALAQPVVPARPGQAAARQQAVVGMQHDLVGLVGNRAQRIAFGTGGVGEQCQRLVAVAGEHDLVVFLRAAVGRDQFHRVRAAADFRDPRAGQDRVAEAGGQGAEVAARPAPDDAPLRPVIDAQQAVILEKTDEEQQRKIDHALGRGRPDRAAHRQQVAVDEAVAVAIRGEVFAERRLPRRSGRCRDHGSPRG